MKTPLCPICGLELKAGKQIGLLNKDGEDRWSCLACGFTERIEVQHKNGAYRLKFVTEQRKPIPPAMEGDRKEMKAILINNLMCNIRKQRPEWNRKQVKNKAKELADSLFAGSRAQEHEYKKEIEKLRKVDYAETQPVRPEKK